MTQKSPNPLAHFPHRFPRFLYTVLARIRHVFSSISSFLSIEINPILRKLLPHRLLHTLDSNFVCQYNFYPPPPSNLHMSRILHENTSSMFAYQFPPFTNGTLPLCINRYKIPKKNNCSSNKKLCIIFQL